MPTTFPPDFQSAERTVSFAGEIFVVRAYRIIGTPTVIIEAYDLGATYTSHGTVTRSDAYGLLGKTTTRPLPDHLAALPRLTEERQRTVQAHQRAENARAEAIIRTAYPDLDFANDGWSGQVSQTVETTGPWAWSCTSCSAGATGFQTAGAADRDASAHEIGVSDHRTITTRSLAPVAS
jgi:hypothetical protein